MSRFSITIPQRTVRRAEELSSPRQAWRLGITRFSPAMRPFWLQAVKVMAEGLCSWTERGILLGKNALIEKNESCGYGGAIYSLGSVRLGKSAVELRGSIKAGGSNFVYGRGVSRNRRAEPGKECPCGRQSGPARRSHIRGQPKMGRWRWEAERGWKGTRRTEVEPSTCKEAVAIPQRFLI